MPIQKCPMCLETKNVVSSHLHPAALYPYCRNADDESPMRVGDGVVMQTDRQTQAYLLCVECEDILNKGGEMWVNPKLATIQKTFPLHDLLMKGPATYQDEDGGLYCAALNPEIEVEKLTHFAMGIFWKGSVHSWKGKEQKPLIDLGPYSDLIRLWLRSEGTFPKDVCITVVLARPERALITLSGPGPQSKKEWHSYIVHVPGVAFTLHVGNRIDPQMRDTCFHENPGHPVIVSDMVMAGHWKHASDQYLESRKTESYLKGKAKRSLKPNE
jgi:hypothetical protein